MLSRCCVCVSICIRIYFSRPLATELKVCVYRMKSENNLKVKNRRRRPTASFSYFLSASVVMAKTRYIFAWNRSPYFRYRGALAEFSMFLQTVNLQSGSPPPNTECANPFIKRAYTVPNTQVKIKVKVTLVQALRLCTGHTAHSGSRGIPLLFHDQRI